VKLLVNCGAAIAAPSSSDTMGMVAANAGSTPLHLAAMKVQRGRAGARVCGGRCPEKKSYGRGVSTTCSIRTMLGLVTSTVSKVAMMMLSIQTPHTCSECASVSQLTYKRHDAIRKHTQLSTGWGLGASLIISTRLTPPPRPPPHSLLPLTPPMPLHTYAQGEVGVVRLLLLANKKLMGLVAADPSLAAAAGSSSGATQDLRGVADSYGKTAGRLAWDMQR